MPPAPRWAVPTVKFTTDKTSEAKDRKYPYSFPTDASGNYTGTGIPPGDYLVVVDEERRADRTTRC